MSPLPPITTPLIHVGKWFPGTDLWVKDESHCPTGTFKDRLAWAYVAGAHNKTMPAGRHTILASITLGNTMRSFAHAVQKGLPPELRPQLAAVIPDDFARRIIGPDARDVTCQGQAVLNELEAAGVRCIPHPLRAGFIEDTEFNKIVNHTGDAGVFNVTNGIGVPAYKQIIAEALAAMPRSPDHIILPVGAGVLFKECVELVLERKLACHVTGVAVTAAESIADKIYGIYSEFYQDLQSAGVAVYGGDQRFKVLRIDDRQILDVRRKPLPPGFERAEPSAWAALVPLANGTVGNGTVLVVNTGSGIPAPSRGVDRILNVLKSVRSKSNPIAARFYDTDPLGGGKHKPLGVAEAIGQLSHSYLEAAKQQGLLDGVVLSRLLLGYDTEADYKRTYDRVSLISRVGDAASASVALRCVLAYIKASEGFSAKEAPDPAMDPSVQLVRKIFAPDPKPDPDKRAFRPTGEELAYVFYPGAAACTSGPGFEIQGWLPNHAPYRQPARVLIERLVEVLKKQAVEIRAGEDSANEETIDKDPVLKKEVMAVIAKWRAHEGARFHETEDPRVLLLAAMEVLGPDSAFIAVPLPLEGQQSFYKWAGLWCVSRLPVAVDPATSSRTDQFYTLNLIGRALMAEVQGYAYRLASWQARTLAENYKNYERFVGMQFLPLVLGQKTNWSAIPFPVGDGAGRTMHLGEFFPQVPFGQAGDSIIISGLMGFLNVQSAGYMSRQLQTIEGMRHEMQQRLIDQACVTKEAFELKCRDLESRARSLGIHDLLPEKPGTLSIDERKALLRSTDDKLKALRNTREYIAAVIGQNLKGRGGVAGSKDRKPRFDFDYKLDFPDLVDRSWKGLERFCRELERIHPLPFTMDRVSGAVEALAHNFEKHSKPHESCRLLASEDEACFEMLWCVSGGEPPFPDFPFFCRKVVDPRDRGTVTPEQLEEEGYGIHRGLPLALMFGFESGAKQIAVWIGGGKAAGDWHPVIGKKFVSKTSPIEGTTYALGWRWYFERKKLET